jgi:hypothetical protein
MCCAWAVPRGPMLQQRDGYLDIGRHGRSVLYGSTLQITCTAWSGPRDTGVIGEEDKWKGELLFANFCVKDGEGVVGLQGQGEPRSAKIGQVSRFVPFSPPFSSQVRMRTIMFTQPLQATSAIIRTASHRLPSCCRRGVLFHPLPVLQPSSWLG